MAVVYWRDPFRELAHIHERMNHVIDTFGRTDTGRDEEGLLTAGRWLPPVDIYEHGDRELVLKAELPDMTREDIDITVDNGTLTIKGEKKCSRDVKEEQFHRMERRYGTFSRSFSLPRTVDTAKVGAEYTNGVLTVRLPLREEARPRQIKVDVAA